jgi:hypothetical protein
MFRLLLRVYIDQLLKGNPIAVIFTIIWVSAVSVGPFYEGVSRRDPGALALMGLVGFLCVVFLVIVIVDKKLNPTKPTQKKSKSVQATSRRETR